MEYLSSFPVIPISLQKTIYLAKIYVNPKKKCIWTLQESHNPQKQDMISICKVL